MGSIKRYLLLMSRAINIIDFEASGLHELSYPIEVSVQVNHKSHSWLIKPVEGWQYWCSTAESMHGIKRDTLLCEGLTVDQVARELNQAFEHSSRVVHSDAANWDDFWLKRLFDAAAISPSFRISSLFNLLDRRQSKVFESVKNQLETSGKYRPHRAAEDVQMIYKALMQARSN